MKCLYWWTLRHWEAVKKVAGIIGIAALLFVGLLFARDLVLVTIAMGAFFVGLFGFIDLLEYLSKKVQRDLRKVRKERMEQEYVKMDAGVRPQSSPAAKVAWPDEL